MKVPYTTSRNTDDRMSSHRIVPNLRSANHHDVMYVQCTKPNHVWMQSPPATGVQEVWQAAGWQGVGVVANVDALQSQQQGCCSTSLSIFVAVSQDDGVMPTAASLTGSSKPSTSAAAIDPRICKQMSSVECCSVGHSASMRRWRLVGGLPGR
jgi:hypothetical protein